MAATKRQIQREAKRATKRSVASQGPTSTLRRTSDSIRTITTLDESPTSAETIPTSLEKKADELLSLPIPPIILEEPEDSFRTQKEQHSEQTQVRSTFSAILLRLTANLDS